MLEKVELDAVVIGTPSRPARRQVRAALERGLHVFCEKPFCLDPAESRRARRSWPRSAAWSRRSATTTASSVPSREVKRLLDAGAIGHGHPRARRGLRARRAQAQGRHLAQPADRGRRLPLRLRRAPARPAHLVLRRARRASAARCSARSSPPRPRTRSSRRCTSPTASTRAALGELVRRVAPQDDDQAHPLGHARAGSSSTARSAGVPARARPRCPRATGRAGTCGTPPSSPTRSGSTCAARSTAPSSTTSSQRVGHRQRRRRERASPAPRDHRPT